jgi:D123
MDCNNLNEGATEPIAVKPLCGKEQGDAILPRVEEVLACQFSSWYPIFSNLLVKYKGRRNVTIPSVIISPLPDEFQEYLLSDQLILPTDTRTSSALLESHNRTPEAGDVWSSDDDASDQDDEDDMRSSNAPKSYSFPSLCDQINAAIRSFHSQACIPKLNWSAPKDAIWINGGGGTMECRCAGDVFLLLKASDFCSYDLQHALQDVAEEEEPAPSLQMELILRKWCNLYPSQEFRCFVVQQQLVAISQRYHSQHWPYLSSARDQYLVLIRDFFEQVVQPNVVASMTQYVFDVYIDQKSRIWLVDINVWASRTDALLFHWSELLERASRLASEEIDPIIEFRIVESEHQILSNPLSSYKAPMMDLVYLGGSEQDRLGCTSKFQEFMKLCERPTTLRKSSNSGDSDSDDDALI